MWLSLTIVGFLITLGMGQQQQQCADADTFASDAITKIEVDWKTYFHRTMVNNCFKLDTIDYQFKFMKNCALKNTIQTVKELAIFTGTVLKTDDIFKVYNRLNEYYLECINIPNTINTKKEMETLAKSTEIFMKEVTKFVSAYTPVAMKKVFDSTGSFSQPIFDFNLEDALNIVNRLEWKNITEREYMVKVMISCRFVGEKHMENLKQFNYYNQEHRNAMIRQVSSWILEQMKCFTPKLVDTCGFYTETLGKHHPNINPNMLELIVKTFEGEKQLSADSESGSTDLLNDILKRFEMN